MPRKMGKGIVKTKFESFWFTIQYAAEKNVITGQRKTELEAINDEGNRWKHDELPGFATHVAMFLVASRKTTSPCRSLLRSLVTMLRLGLPHHTSNGSLRGQTCWRNNRCSCEATKPGSGRTSFAAPLMRLPFRRVTNVQRMYCMMPSITFCRLSHSNGCDGHQHNVGLCVVGRTIGGCAYFFFF